MANYSNMFGLWIFLAIIFLLKLWIRNANLNAKLTDATIVAPNGIAREILILWNENNLFSLLSGQEGIRGENYVFPQRGGKKG